MMMKIRNIRVIVPLAVALLMASCAADSQSEQGQPANSRRAIRLTATVSAGPRADSRAAADIQSEQFDEGETFYAYFPNGVSVGSVTSASHTTFTTTNTSGATNPTTQPYFNAGTDNARVYAYYPQSVTNSTSSFSVALDQTETSGYKASDLMYATTTVVVDKSSETSATGNLTFNHKMSKIIVTAARGQGVSKILKVRIVGGNRTIDIATPATTDENKNPFFGATPLLSDAITTADNGCVKLYEGNTEAASVSCAGLIPPQTVSGSFLQVVTSEGTATYSLASSKTFTAGESYTYNISVSLASIGITTEIDDWELQEESKLVDNGGLTFSVDPYDHIDLHVASVGMIICEHGKAFDMSSDPTAALPCGGEKIAIIAYKGNGEADSRYNNGLALSMADLTGETGVAWFYSDQFYLALPNAYPAGEWSRPINDLNGISYTRILAGSGRFPAADLCADYNSTLATPYNCSNWFLPTMGQWKKMLDALTGGNITWESNDSFKNSAINAILGRFAGSGALVKNQYSSSTEYNEGNIWYIVFSDGCIIGGNKISLLSVRAVLAF